MSRTYNDISGFNTEYLVVIKYIGKTKYSKAIFECQCKCGNIFDAVGADILSGRIISCKCLNKKKITESNKKRTKHGHCKDFTNTIEYRLWSAIKKRCYNSNQKSYKYYGGRGITMYEPWINDFITFKDWILNNLGKRPIDKPSLDRYPDKDGNYMPGNIRWADATEQNNNRNKKGYLNEQ